MGAAKDGGRRVASPGGRFPLSGRAWHNVIGTLRLSPREAQIVPFIFADATEDTIARVLGISRHTVHTYLERLYQKLGVSSRVELVVRLVTEYLAMVDGKQ